MQVIDDMGNNCLAPQSTLYLGQINDPSLTLQRKNFTSNQNQIKTGFGLAGPPHLESQQQRQLQQPPAQLLQRETNQNFQIQHRQPVPTASECLQNSNLLFDTISQLLANQENIK